MTEELTISPTALPARDSQRGAIAKAALVVMLGNVASRLLGMVREQTIAGFFGASNATDAFAAAASIPNAFYDLLIGGMISAALVPVFSSFGEGEDRETWTLVSLVINLAAIGLGLAVVVLIAFSGPLAAVVGHGFDQDKQQLTSTLLQLMLPSVLFMGISGVLSAYLYSRRAFVLPALCAATYNLSIILGAVLFRHPLGVSSLAVGVLAGGIFQILLQLPGLRGFHYRRVLSLRHPGVRKIGQLYLPVFLGLIVSTITVIIDRNLASRTGEGSVAAMRFATALMQLPLGLIAVALSTALLPTLSAYAHRESEDAKGSGCGTSAGQGPTSGFRGTLGLGLRLVILLILPAAAALVVLREPVIRLLYEHGIFRPEDTARTATAFLAYSPGLPAAAIDQLLIFAFYARKNTWTPALVGVAGVAVYLAVGLPLLTPLGMPGLALANAAQWVAHMSIMWLLLARAIGGFGGLGLGTAALKALAAAAATALTIGAVAGTLGRIMPTGSLAGLTVYVGVLVTIGLLAYGISVYVLDVAEVQFLWRAFRTKLAR